MTEPRPPIRPRDDDWPETRDYHREQAEEIARLRDAMRVALEGFEIVAGKRQCIDNLMGHADIAEWCIAKIKEALNDA